MVARVRREKLLPFLAFPCILGSKMTYSARQFFGFTYRYWRSIAALAESPVHI